MTQACRTYRWKVEWSCLAAGWVLYEALEFNRELMVQPKERQALLSRQTTRRPRENAGNVLASVQIDERLIPLRELWIRRLLSHKERHSLCSS